MTDTVKTYSIGNTKEMLALLFQIAKIAKEAKTNDGKFTVADITLVMGLIPYLSPAFGDINEMPNELKDLTQDEINELVAYIAAKTGEVVGNEKLIVQLEAGLAVVKAIVAFIGTLKKD